MTRNAKKPVYQQFSDSKICWDFTNLPSNLEEIFSDADNKLLVELGAGICYFSTGFAEKHPDWNVLATDLKRDRLWKGAKRAQQQKLINIRFLNINVENLGEIIGEGRVDQLWLTFPDPYSKVRQAKHRMNQPRFLQLYASLLNADGEFHLKTDDSSFFVETIENLLKQNWQITKLNDDLHSEQDEGPEETIKTRYEKEFTEVGLPILYLSAKTEN